MGEYNSVKLLHLKGGSSGIFYREASLLSVDKGGKMSMRLTVVVRLKVSTQPAKAASGHLQQPVGINKIASGHQQICQWAVNKFSSGHQQIFQWAVDNTEAVNNFQHNKSNSELFFTSSANGP